jgi:hypothetical protein
MIGAAMSDNQPDNWNGFHLGDRITFELYGETIVGRVIELVEPIELDGSCTVCNLRVAELPVRLGHVADRVFLVSSADARYYAS